MENIDEQYEKALHLDVVKKILDKYPSVYVGGSIALFLYGIRLKRWLKGAGDIDLWSDKEVNINESTSEGNEKASDGSGKDYKESFTVENIKIDLGISKDQQYEVIKYKNSYFRVNKLENIWAAKLRYKNHKHIDDLKEALGIKEPERMLDLVL